MKKLGLDPRKSVRGDGRVTISYEAGQRLDCYVTANARLVLSARIATVPNDPVPRRLFLRNALTYAAARAQDHHDTLAMTRDDDGLLLQCEVDGAAPLFELEAGFSEFFNAIDAWKRTSQSWSNRS
ncbi:MAG: CesT family type III secretion system chaperone [Pseudomonadota bacterium]